MGVREEAGGEGRREKGEGRREKGKGEGRREKIRGRKGGGGQRRVMVGSVGSRGQDKRGWADGREREGNLGMPEAFKDGALGGCQFSFSVHPPGLPRASVGTWWTVRGRLEQRRGRLEDGGKLEGS
jgi:hypothetical protein